MQGGGGGGGGGRDAPKGPRTQWGQPSWMVQGTELIQRLFDRETERRREVLSIQGQKALDQPARGTAWIGESDREREIIEGTGVVKSRTLPPGSPQL